MSVSVILLVIEPSLKVGDLLLKSFMFKVFQLGYSCNCREPCIKLGFKVLELGLKALLEVVKFPHKRVLFALQEVFRNTACLLNYGFSKI